MTPRRFSSRWAGFTLVEVLVALSVVTILLPVVMGGVSLALRTSGLARQRLEAANLAQSKLAELIGTGEWQTSTLSGDFNPDWPAYSWSAQVSQYQGTTSASATVPGASVAPAGLPSTASSLAASMASPGSGATSSGLQQLDVTVNWTARGNTYSVTLSTLVYAGST